MRADPFLWELTGAELLTKLVGTWMTAVTRSGMTDGESGDDWAGRGRGIMDMNGGEVGLA